MPRSVVRNILTWTLPSNCTYMTQSARLSHFTGEKGSVCLFTGRIHSEPSTRIRDGYKITDDDM